MKSKTAIILYHNSWRLANQLWNYISIYAFCLEEQMDCINWSRFEYYKLFPNTKSSKLINIIYSNFVFNFFNRNVVQILYQKTIRLFIKVFFSKHIIEVNNKETKQYYLKENIDIKKHNKKYIFFDWRLFRDPNLISKYRKEIKQHFSPKKNIIDNINNYITDKRKKYKHIVWVHIRQGDFKRWQWWKYFISLKDFAKTIMSYKKYYKNDVCFIVCSDWKINLNDFELNDCFFGLWDPVSDLFLLAETDFIISSNSTFSAFASYYWDIPSFVLSNKYINKNINRDFFVEKKWFRENPDYTMVKF